MKINGNDPIAQCTLNVTKKTCDGDHETMPEVFVGLTKREYFAAMAMQNMTRLNFNEAHPYEVAEKSVKFADALINELNKEAKND